MCNYIRSRVGNGDFQCIVISLKDMFYELSESLIGVCRDVGLGASRTLTLDLTKFDGEAVGDGGEKRDLDISDGGMKRARVASVQ